MNSKHSTAHFQRKLALARDQFFNRGEQPETLLDPVILRSWQRCRSFGVDPAWGLAPKDLIDSPTLAAARVRNAHLLRHGGVTLGHFLAQLRISGSLAMLADADGLILETYGDAGLSSRAGCIGLLPGGAWSEFARGTNAIGTALADESMVRVQGGEHYCEHDRLLTSIASPVLGADGRVLGALSVFSAYPGDGLHLDALLSLAVAMIEQRLFESAFARDFVVSFRRKEGVLPDHNEGLAAFSAAGQVLAINRAGLALLGVRRADAAGRSFAMVFERDFSWLAESLRRDVTGSVEFKVGGAMIEMQARGPLPAPSFVRSGEASGARGEALPRQVAGQKPGITLDTLNSGDPRLQTAIERAKRILGRDIPLLIQGESGVGKELFAKGFHHSGPRHGKPFVALNCASIPESLIESELFGYQGGAFTGARKEGALGKIQQAHGGTLFLDEIGDMPLALQARLLRVLQERCVTPLGSAQTIPVDISLVCATHRRLSEEVARGNFREDLYYRLNSLCITLPALRERSDIRRLVTQMVSAEAGAHRSVRFSPEAMAALESYPWPGNIRQLFNVVRVAVTLLDEGESEIGIAHLPEEVLEKERPPVTSARIISVDHWAAVPAESADSLDQIERKAVRRALDAAGGNISAAARTLGVSRNTLYRILGKARIDCDEVQQQRVG